ncbi:MAG TPA: alpha/beta hydrolase-fold protein [Allosphingosinicella sp.]|jgi:hypothetical protein
MKTTLLKLAAAIALAAPGIAAAQTPEGKSITIGTSFALPSAILGEAREINVHLPASYADTKEVRSYPVLYVLDGGVDQDFTHIAGIAQHGEMSWTFDDLIVVGISTKKRIWELTTPTLDERYSAYFQANGESAKVAGGGGSIEFRRHIAEEVIPYIEKTYRTNDRRVVMGESLAGLFVVDTLLRQPALFNDYVAISPSLWWNREELGNRAAEMLKRRDYAGRRLYLTLGAEGGTMGRAVGNFVAALKSPAAGALKWTFVDRGNSEHHGSIYHAAALDALRTLYPQPWRPGVPYPWFHIGPVKPLSAAAEADRKIPCTAARAKRATFAEINRAPEKWDAFCVLTPLGEAPEPRLRSANWFAPEPK